MLMATSAMSGTLPNLKERLYQDWGYDLSIAPGLSGDGTKLSPIVINSSDPKEIIRSAFFTVQGLHRGRSQMYKSDGAYGMFWKIIEGLTYNKEHNLYFLRVKRIILTEEEKITETTRYYFSVPKLEIPIIDPPQLPISYVDNNSKVKLPFEIGYLQNIPRSFVDYGKEYGRPDQGYSLAFGTTGVKATVYFYPAPSKITPIALKHEFEKASDELISFSKEDLIEWLEDADEGNLHVKYWRVTSDFPKGTTLWLFIHNEQFVKIRMTWDRDPTIDEIGFEFVSALYEALN